MWMLHFTYSATHHSQTLQRQAVTWDLRRPTSVYFGHLLKSTDSFEKTLMLGRIEGGRRSRRQRMRYGWMASLTRGMWVWVTSGSWWWTGRPGVLQSMGSQRVGHDWVTELNWTEITWTNSVVQNSFCISQVTCVIVWFVLLLYTSYTLLSCLKPSKGLCVILPYVLFPFLEIFIYYL